MSEEKIQREDFKIKLDLLSTGSLKHIYRREKSVNQIVIQIIDLKKIFMEENAFYQLIISDGEYWSNLAILSCDFNEMVQSESLTKKVIIELHKFDLFAVKSEKDCELVIMLIKQLNIRKNRKEVILGNPKQLILNTVELFNNQKSKSYDNSNAISSPNSDFTQIIVYQLHLSRIESLCNIM